MKRQKERVGTSNNDELQALVLEGSKERGRGQARGHQMGTGRGRRRSQPRDRTFKCFYYDQEGHIKRNCLKYKAQDQSSKTAVTTVMAVDESDILLAASADGKMLDSKGCSFTSSRGILRVSKENKEMLRGRKTRGVYRMLESVQRWGATVRHGSSGTRKKNGQGKQQLHRDMQIKRRVVRTREERCGEMEPDKLAKYVTLRHIPVGGVGHFGVEVQTLRSYGRAGPEAIRMENLKTSDYPLGGWKGRLLSPAHLDEFKPTYLGPSAVVSHGVSM
ncbi:hypothetical protein Acr_21g0011720 [Actinidia rufa]|uniref:Uncharacterized protein n=1 Tax=Actinidia rufa TaxID=165716 RepID=A0A7J0GID0_9ERIC|nr:hypothetical protein Acr_21g0011720 [Actinidia rufa]